MCKRLSVNPWVSHISVEDLRLKCFEAKFKSVAAPYLSVNKGVSGVILDLLGYFILIIIVLWILSASIKVVREYERGVVFRLGRFIGAKGPGLFFIVPIADRFIKIDLRIVAFDISKQRVVTKDNVSVDVDAAVYYRVFDPAKAVLQVENYLQATNLLAQTTLRDVLGQVELDDLLTKREELSKKIGEILDIYTDPWGVKVTAVAIKDVSIDETMLRAIAKQAEAERERRARIIVAEGEYLAAEKIAAAAEKYTTPGALRLRELQTLTEIAREKNMVVVTSTTAEDIGKIASMVKALQEGK
ncbi:slipin family protein [Candidatus Bathyarchaeota archaeon]|nr:slipin family protein [Candidatus Bathyarchaeota archaeon]